MGQVRDHALPAPAVTEPVRTFSVPQILFGAGTLSEVGAAAGRLGGARVFVVSDPGVVAAGWVAEAVTALDDAGLDHVLFHDVTPNPKDHEIHAAFEAYVEHGCDVLVAVGGGSCIDAAKGVAILSAMGGDILDYEGVDKVTRPLPPLVMCPSTGGTGADVSQFAVITDTTRRLKATLIGRALVPVVSITDPRLLTTMDAELTAATGLDALSHGIEAYASVAASFLTDGLALSAISRVVTALPRCVDDPDDLDARTEMARASLHAGMAFTNSLLGVCHALSHQIGGCLDLPHGCLNGVLLPHVMSFNAPFAPDRYVDIAEALGIETAGMDAEEAADAACTQVQLLAAKLGIPRHLSSLGVRAEDFGDFAEHALADACLLTNPRPVGLDDARELFHAAL